MLEFEFFDGHRDEVAIHLLVSDALFALRTPSRHKARRVHLVTLNALLTEDDFARAALVGLYRNAFANNAFKIFDDVGDCLRFLMIKIYSAIACVVNHRRYIKRPLRKVNVALAECNLRFFDVFHQLIKVIHARLEQTLSLFSN